MGNRVSDRSRLPQGILQMYPQVLDPPGDSGVGSNAAVRTRQQISCDIHRGGAPPVPVSKEPQ